MAPRKKAPTKRTRKVSTKIDPLDELLAQTEDEFLAQTADEFLAQTDAPQNKNSAALRQYVVLREEPSVNPNIEKFRQQSIEYAKSLSKYDQITMIEWTNLLDQLVNLRIRGLSWSQILDTSSGPQGSFRDKVESNVGQTSLFFCNAQSRRFLKRTAWFLSLSKQIQSFFSTIIDIYCMNQEERSVFQTMYKDSIEAILGSSFLNALAQQDDNLDPMQLVLIYYTWTHTKTMQPELIGNHLGPFDEIFMEAILDQAILDLKRIFSSGPVLQEPLVIYRGLRETPQDRASFRGASTDILNALLQTDRNACCLMIIRVPAGVRLFEFSSMFRAAFADEHEVMIVPGVNLVMRNEKVFRKSEWPPDARKFAFDIQAQEYDWIA